MKIRLVNFDNLTIHLMPAFVYITMDFGGQLPLTPSALWYSPKEDLAMLASFCYFEEKSRTFQCMWFAIE